MLSEREEIIAVADGALQFQVEIGVKNNSCSPA
jgi:hypothetical protein